MRFTNAYLFTFLVGILAAGSATTAPADEHTHWIWSDVERQADTRALFRKEFNADKPVTSAIVRCVGESTSIALRLNETVIAELDPYDPMLQIDMTEQLRIGKQTLHVDCTSVDGPAAFFLRLDLVFEDGTQQSIVTDKAWIASRERAADENAAVSFGLVSSRLLIPRDRQVGILATDNYEQWKQAQGAQPGTDPASFLVTPGFEIDLVRSAQADEDSWVSLAFDPQGRAVIAKEGKGLLRMALTPDGSHVANVETINDDLLECRGLLFAFGDLFANANNSKGLYRLRGDGKDGFKKPELLYESSGGVGHGRNDLALGPDDKIYMIHGDSVQLPKDAIDHTSPFRDARNGKPTSEGHLLRIDPNGGKVEVVAAGLRNPFGIDFNSDGEVFTYDADAEFDMGSPWYRPTRVSHLVPGGDYGWRGVTGSWPPYYIDHADNALPNLDIGKGSPTAVKFGTRSNFPPKHRDALFILDWAYGRILAVHQAPRGSSYLLTAETFLKGRPLNVTDLDFGPDGSMYFVTGGRKTQSALYRVRYVGEEESRRAAYTPQQFAREKFAAISRELRRRLERYLLEEIDNETVDEVWRHLSNSDPWIRHAARNVLERQPIKSWQERAFRETDKTAAATVLLALARSNRPELHSHIVGRLNAIDWRQATRTEKLSALYCYWRCMRDDAELPTQLVADAVRRLNELYPDRSYRVNRLLSEILVPRRAEGALAKTLALLTTASDQHEQMHYLFAMRDVKEGWTLDQRKTYFRELTRSQHFVGGQGMPGFISKIREEATATLASAERESLGPLLKQEPQGTLVETPPRALVNKWTAADLADSLNEVARNRNLHRGEAMFAAASCIKCHRIAGRGTLIGPDLTSVSSRFSRRDMLESILTPSKVIAEKYRSLQVVTSDGKTYVGQVALGGDYRSPILRLAVDPNQPFKITEIPKSDIDEQQHSKVSWMPQGLLDTLSKDEILDLLAYIESRGEVAR